MFQAAEVLIDHYGARFVLLKGKVPIQSKWNSRTDVGLSEIKAHMRAGGGDRLDSR